jgi:hypothetical protein
MAAVLNRTTKVYLPSANTPDYPVAEWIINPDMSAVAGQPSKYWTITGDIVTLMSQAERDAVDANLLNASRDVTANVLAEPEAYPRGYALVALDELNAHALKTNAILDAVDAATTLADLKSRIALITDYPQRTIQQMQNAVRSKLGT